MKFVILSMVLAGSPVDVDQVLESDRTYHYDSKLLKQVYQNEFRVFRLGFDHRPGSRTAFSPNEFRPWIKPGGTDGLKVRTKKSVWIPEGRKITVYTSQVKTEGNVRQPAGYPLRDRRQVKWIFPEGATIVERLYNGSEGEPFELRRRTKSSGTWVTDVTSLNGSAPAGYKQPSNCTQCHDDVGKHASVLENKNNVEWFGTVRGSDGIFSFHPFKYEGGSALRFADPESRNARERKRASMFDISQVN